MYNSWYDVFPEIVMISDKELQKKVVETYEEALKTGGWQLNDIDTIPFTLLIPDTMISYRTHVRTVTRMSLKAYEEWEAQDEIRRQEIAAQRRAEREQLGKNLRHPFSGCALAVKHGLPVEVAHIIANHAKEGDGTLRSPEGVIVNKCDMLNFEGLKAFVGMI